MRYIIFIISVVSAFLLFTSPTYAQSGNLTTSGVLYNADSSGNSSRSRSTLIQVPVNLINPTQSWVAFRAKIGFDSTTSLSPDPVMWDMSESDPADLFVYYDVGSDTFHLVRASKIGGKTLASAKQTFTTGTTKTVIAAWTGTTMKLSVDGAPFVQTAESIIPKQAPFLIASTLVQGSGRQPNSDYYWVAGGTGTLTDGDAASINSFGNTDKRRIDFPGNATFVWWANNNQYNNDGSIIPTTTPVSTATNTPSPRPTGTATPSATSTPTRAQTATPRATISAGGLPGDANGDGRVDGVDFIIWIQNYDQSINGAQNGDFDGDGKVDGVDYVIWFTNYSDTGNFPSPTPGTIGQSLLRVDAGGSSDYTDSNNNVWSADNGFSGGTAVDRGNISISNTNDQRIYQTERYGMSGYRFNVTNNLYRVKLHFAETSGSISSAGQRVFSVNVEGQTLSNIDVFSEAGGRNAALVKTVDVDVNDGQLTIDFIPSVQNAEINGIEIESSDGSVISGNPTPTSTNITSGPTNTPRPTGTSGPTSPPSTNGPSPTGVSGNFPCGKFPNANPGCINVSYQSWFDNVPASATTMNVDYTPRLLHQHYECAVPAARANGQYLRQGMQTVCQFVRYNSIIPFTSGNSGWYRSQNQGSTYEQFTLNLPPCQSAKYLGQQCITENIHTVRASDMSSSTEMRFTPNANFTGMGGDRHFLSSNWQTAIGYRSSSELTTRYWIGQCGNYQRMILKQSDKYDKGNEAIPTVSGTITIPFETNGGCGSQFKTFVFLDPSQHVRDFGTEHGTTLMEVNSHFNGNLTWDTTKTTNGVHSLLFINMEGTSSYVSASGVMVKYIVQN